MDALLGVLSVLAAAAAAVALVLAVAAPAAAGAGALRIAGLTGSGLVLVAALADRLSGWPIGFAVAGVIAALQAIALHQSRCRTLREYAAMRGRRRNGDPPWWPEFERDLRAHLGPLRRRGGRTR